MPSTVYLNQSFDVLLKIDNDDDEDAELETWSYIYRRNKKYCLEMVNLKYIRGEEEDTKEVRLKNKVKEEMKAAISLKGRLEKGQKDSYDQIKDISLKVPERICEKSGKSSLTAVKDDKENKEMRERKEVGEKEREEEETNRQRLCYKKTRLYLNQRHSHQKDGSGIHDNPVFADLIILSQQD